MSHELPVPPSEGRRIVICDYNALLLSVTGLLRMSGYAVFQAHDGWAAQELCLLLPNIDLLVLNTYGTGIDVSELCRSVRHAKRGLPILHIGSTTPPGLPSDVPTLAEQFTADSLLLTVQGLIEPALKRRGTPYNNPPRMWRGIRTGGGGKIRDPAPHFPWGSPFQRLFTKQLGLDLLAAFTHHGLEDCGIG